MSVPVDLTCASLELPNGVRVREATHARIIEVTGRLSRIAELGYPLRACELADDDAPPTAFSAKTVKDGAIIQGYLIIARSAAERYSDAAFLGLLAHETAHVPIAPEPACNIGIYGNRLPPVEERVACEAPVDAKAASWVGKPVMLTMLREVQKFMSPLLDADFRTYNDAEIAARITFLEEATRRDASAKTTVVR
ncbi:MAG: hypothetical protein RL681_234 [Candidatus Parcubacteria bacterium]|jgi:hypothetical protein